MKKKGAGQDGGKSQRLIGPQKYGRTFGRTKKTNFNALPLIPFRNQHIRVVHGNLIAKSVWSKEKTLKT